MCAILELMAKREIYDYDDDGEACYPAAIVRADVNDLDTYEPDLDWWFNVYDSECGLRSIGLGGLEMAFDSDGCRHKWSDGSTETVHMLSGHGGNPVNDPWSDAKHLKAFSRGRRVWAKLCNVSWANQSVLRRFYEPRYPLEKDQNWGMPIPSRNDVIEALRWYRGEVRLMGDEEFKEYCKSVNL